MQFVAFSFPCFSCLFQIFLSPISNNFVLAHFPFFLHIKFLSVEFFEFISYRLSYNDVWNNQLGSVFMRR